MKRKMGHCERIQVEIAWGRGLAPQLKKHLRACEVCREAAEKFSRLDQFFEPGVDPAVPDGFADRLETMAAKDLEKTTLSRQSFFWQLAYSKAVQWLLAVLGLFFGLDRRFGAGNG